MEFSPFRGMRFNQEIVGDLARVICPRTMLSLLNSGNLTTKKVITTVFAWNSPSRQVIDIKE